MIDEGKGYMSWQRLSTVLFLGSGIIDTGSGIIGRQPWILLLARYCSPASMLHRDVAKGYKGGLSFPEKWA
jgi:hypothetical protein